MFHCFRSTIFGRCSLLFVLSLCVHAGGPLQAQEELSDAQQEFQRLETEFQQRGGADQLAPKMLALASAHPQEVVAIDALTWVLKQQVREEAHLDQAVRRLVEQHADREELIPHLPKLVLRVRSQTESLLRGLVQHSSRQRVQAHARFQLARHLMAQLDAGKAIQERPLFLRRFEQAYGKQMTARLRNQDRAKVQQEAEELLEQVADQHGHVEVELVAVAATQLRELRYLSVGATAQEITGTDVDGVPFKLSDYRGKVVMLSFWGHW